MKPQSFFRIKFLLQAPLEVWEFFVGFRILIFLSVLLKVFLVLRIVLSRVSSVEEISPHGLGHEGVELFFRLESPNQAEEGFALGAEAWAEEMSSLVKAKEEEREANDRQHPLEPNRLTPGRKKASDP